MILELTVLLVEDDTVAEDTAEEVTWLVIEGPWAVVELGVAAEDVAFAVVEVETTPEVLEAVLAVEAVTLVVSMGGSVVVVDNKL